MWRRFLFWSSTAGIYNRARPRERGDRGLFLPIGKKSLFIPGCVQGAIILISLSVWVCLTFVDFTDVGAVRGRFPQTRDLWKRSSMDYNGWGVFRCTSSRVGRGRWAAVDFVVCFGRGGISCFFLVFFSSNFERTRPVASMRPPCLIYLSTSTDCESRTRPISTNPGSMEAGKYGLTRGTCFVARRLEVVAVAGLLWISWCVLRVRRGLFRVFHN